MSLFDTLKNAIFRHGSTASAGGPAASTGQVTRPAGQPPAGQAPVAPAPKAATPAPQTAPAAPVDVEAVLDALNAKSSQKLAWRTSIVDLMKLVGMDSSFQHRKELATELGYKGDTADSASMNIWLHTEVMKKLAANGGKVPASLQ